MSLEEKLRHKIDLRGGITFADFMESALYDPEEGYYRQDPPPVGRNGDFITAAEMGPLFGDLIGKWISELWRRFSPPASFEIVEYGPGLGSWAKAIVTFLQENYPLCCRSLQYLLQETSLSMRKAIVDSCKNMFFPDGPFFWPEQPDPRKEQPAFRLILANEFLDALPVHWIRREKDRLLEVYVVWKESAFRTENGPLSDPLLHDYFNAPQVSLPEGKQAFLSTRIPSWLEEISRDDLPALTLLFDYGSTADVLYHPCRPSPRPACFAAHTAGWDPLARPGFQDITVDVDFTALEYFARRCGWKQLMLRPQSSFLLELVRTAGEELCWQARDRRQNLKILTHPEIMGEAFQACLLGKNLPQPVAAFLTGNQERSPQLRSLR